MPNIDKPEFWKDPEAVVPVQKPSQGRIVLYRHPGSADGRYPSQTSPAMVQSVDAENPYKCLLFVFGPKGQHMDWCEHGDGPCQWAWPPRI